MTDEAVTPIPLNRRNSLLNGRSLRKENDLMNNNLWLDPVPLGLQDMAQARRVGKHVGRPARRRFHSAEKMRALWVKGTSIRKLPTDFHTTQWMASRLTSSAAAISVTLGG